MDDIDYTRRPKLLGYVVLLTYELVLMAADGVEGEGEAHADDGAGEEAHEHHLLLNLYLG